MSKTHNHSVKTWEDLQCKLLSGNGTDLPAADYELYIHSLIINSAIMEDHLSPFLDHPKRFLIPACQCMAVVEPYLLAKTFKECLNAFLQLSVGESVLDFLADFKSRHKEIEGWGIIISPISSLYRVTNGKQFREGVAATVQFLSGWSRIKLDSYDYSERCLQEYLDNEERLAKLAIPTSITSALNVILKEWLETFDVENLRSYEMRHGPGASAMLGRGSIADKYLLLGTDPLLNYSFPYLGIEEYPVVKHRTCQVVFVPKSILTWRTISMEPAHLMFVQQAGFTMLSRWFKYHPTLSRVIHLDDASVNRKAAQVSSQPTNNGCTIDLSSASDSVSWALIKAITRGTPLLRLFAGTRSNTAQLPDGRMIPLAKYAPMGSALCFPVECLVFSLICEYAQRMCHGLGKPKYLVYGDDIVIPHSMWDVTSDLLEACGFTINEAKSFVRHDVSFRESCGGEYWNGLDVTPIRLPRNFAIATRRSLLISSALYEQRVDLTNSLYIRNHRVARSLVLSPLLELPQPLRPLFGPEVPGVDQYSYVLSSSPTNSHLISQIEIDRGKDFPFYGGTTYTHGALVDNKDHYHFFDHHHSYIEVIKLQEWYRNTYDRSELTTPLSMSVARTTCSIRATQTILT